MTTTIYFARRVTGYGPIKIGISVRPASRMFAISQQVGERVRVIASAPGDFGDERILHRQFASIKLMGEWFRPEPVLLMAVDWVVRHGILPNFEAPAQTGGVAASIIDRLGGAAQVARELRCPLTTVATWGTKNSIPKWRRDPLIELAQSKGVTLGKEDFPTLAVTP